MGGIRRNSKDVIVSRQLRAVYKGVIREIDSREEIDERGVHDAR